MDSDYRLVGPVDKLFYRTIPPEALVSCNGVDFKPATMSVGMAWAPWIGFQVFQYAVPKTLWPLPDIEELMKINDFVARHGFIPRSKI
jgi:hypothetical protein